MAEIHSVPHPKNEDALSGADSFRNVGEALRPSWWWLVLGISVALVFATFFVGFVWLSLVPIELFIIGISIATALDPLVDFMCKKMNRLEAILLIYLIGLILFGVVLWLVIPAMIGEAQALIKTVPQLIDTAQATLNRYGFLSNLNIVNSLKSQIGTAANIIIKLPVGIFYSLFEIVVIVFVSLYALALEPGIRDFYFSLFPKSDQKRVSFILAQAASAMGGYVRASFIDGILMGIAAYGGFLIIGVHYPLVLAVITAVLELIPSLGPLVAGVLATLFALLQSPTMALIVLVFFIILQQLETHVLVPNVMRTQTEISPLIVVFALLVGYEIGGLLGALASIPLAGLIKVTVGEFIAPVIRQKTGAIERHDRPSEIEEREEEEERREERQKEKEKERKE